MEIVAPASVGLDWGEKQKNREHYVLLDAVDPRDGGLWKVLLEESKFASCQGRPWAGKTLAYTVPEILLAPAAIFAGIRGDDAGLMDDPRGLAYVGTPNLRYWGAGQHGLDNQGPCPDHLVFVVYLNDERVIFTWRYERTEADGSAMPTGWSGGRYRYRIL